MKVLISTLGSRGDTQPYLALALGLQQAGHQVTLTAPSVFKDWIESYGVAAHAVRFDPLAIMRSLGNTKNPFQAMRVMREVAAKGVQEAMNDVWLAAQETDFLLQTGTGSAALEAAFLRHIPVAFAYLVPMQPTRAFPQFMLPFRNLSNGRLNYLTHTLLRELAWRSMGGPTTNRWRARIGLPGWRSETEMQAYVRQLSAPALYGYSPYVLPKPADWDESQHVTGYWFLDGQPGWQPGRELLQFLESGPPPVYIGFGSMSHADPERQARLALRALELSGQRGILLTGWGGIQHLEAPPSVFFVEDVPHAWLFPRMAAVVHHGGAGTTAAALRAGVPAIITPFASAGDQGSWADLVVKLGAGPKADTIKRMSAEKLAKAIQQCVNNPAMRANAATLGEQIRLENGVSKAVALIEQHAADNAGRTG